MSSLSALFLRLGRSTACGAQFSSASAAFCAARAGDSAGESTAGRAGEGAGGEAADTCDRPGEGGSD